MFTFHCKTIFWRENFSVDFHKCLLKQQNARLERQKKLKSSICFNNWVVFDFSPTWTQHRFCHPPEHSTANPHYQFRVYPTNYNCRFARIGASDCLHIDSSRFDMWDNMRHIIHASPSHPTQSTLFSFRRSFFSLFLSSHSTHQTG